MSLWCSSDPTQWEATWQRYEDAIASLGKPVLKQLDGWYREELPLLLHKRRPNAWMSQKELDKLMQWKLSKGKWRPRLQQYIQALDPKEVEATTREAFKLLDQKSLRKALETLGSMKGVGPATASAILAVYDPSSCAFMADEALEAVAKEIGARQYTLAHALRYIDLLVKKAATLNGANSGSDTDSSEERDKKWTAEKVALCLFAEAHTTKDKDTKAKATTNPKKKATTATKRKQPIVVEPSAEEHPVQTTITSKRPKRSCRANALVYPS